jgi:hypothetical protein
VSNGNRRLLSAIKCPDVKNFNPELRFRKHAVAFVLAVMEGTGKR